MTARNDTFLVWLAQQARRDDPVGDSARDMLDDPDWPPTATSFETAWAYLESVNASQKAIEALREAWNEWGRAR
jgi:uncharacterized protein YozE (UPF0346 family)